MQAKNIAAAAALGMCLGLSAQASPSSDEAPHPPQTRWINADDLRLRAGPGAAYPITRMLLRGSTVHLQGEAGEGYCAVALGQEEGFVACRHLSREPIALPRAGHAGVDAARRWVSARSVNLRDAPHLQASVSTVLPLNAMVTLMSEDRGTGYCAVQTADGLRGHTACLYLRESPVDVDKVLASDPAQAFWLNPGWDLLQRHAVQLHERDPEQARQGPWPRDEALERMKAHLALGLKAPRPQPYVDWSQLKHWADQYLGLQTQVDHARTKPLESWTQRDHERDWAASRIGYQLTQTTLIAGFGDDEPQAWDAAAFRTAGLLGALEFPRVQPSLFLDESQIAPPGSTAAQASGRFGIVYRQRVTPRPRPGEKNDSGAGLYGMLALTQSLVRPVRQVRLFRDGRTQVTPSLLHMKEQLWHDVDVMCGDWPGEGFGHGDSDDAIWRFVGEQATPGELRAWRENSRKRNPAGSLMYFYMDEAMPAGKASVSRTEIKLDRRRTGFVRGTHLNYDLDGDGVPDLAVWEGEGRSLGHMVPPSTDDRWYRLFLANIDGRWKVLGSDQFSYGCGC